MKRYAIFAVLLLVLTAGAVVLYGETITRSPSRLTISPSEMKDGETKTLMDGDNTITVKRNGDAVEVRIEGAGKARTVTVVRAGDGIRIEDGRDGWRTWTAAHQPRIMIDGTDFSSPSLQMLPRIDRSAQTWFVCPKDHTMLRVPDEKKDDTFKCPVDGTAMEKRKGRGFAFFFDDHEYRSDDM
ncbi:MAG: hypothetical protein QOK37_2744 [Thermoanaerobaculia bacterium]|jgi:hypothetical protein|nr:hypothetical protein [Thermoanaerobaculia bacterium]